MRYRHDQVAAREHNRMTRKTADVASGCLAVPGILAQLGQPGNEAPGSLDGLDRQLWRHPGTGTGLVIGDGLDVVSEAEERTQRYVKVGNVLRQARKLTLHTAMSLPDLAGAFHNQCLRGMQTGKISFAARLLFPRI